MGNQNVKQKYKILSINENDLYEKVDKKKFVMQLNNYWNDRFHTLDDAKIFISNNMIYDVDYIIKKDEYIFTEVSLLNYWKITKELRKY